MDAYLFLTYNDKLINFLLPPLLLLYLVTYRPLLHYIVIRGGVYFCDVETTGSSTSVLKNSRINPILPVPRSAVEGTRTENIIGANSRKITEISPRIM